MKKVKFEKLNDAKFQKLEIDKMKEVKGGFADNSAPIYADTNEEGGGQCCDTFECGHASKD